jgi:hypothetical protein
MWIQGRELSDLANRVGELRVEMDQPKQEADEAKRTRNKSKSPNRRQNRRPPVLTEEDMVPQPVDRRFARNVPWPKAKFDGGPDEDVEAFLFDLERQGHEMGFSRPWLRCFIEAFLGPDVRRAMWRKLSEAESWAHVKHMLRKQYPYSETKHLSHVENRGENDETPRPSTSSRLHAVWSIPLKDGKQSNVEILTKDLCMFKHHTI